jgi:hypothetical protein
MKITKQIVEFLLTINGREEQGSFDGHVFTLKGVTGDQLTRLGAAIEREFDRTEAGPLRGHDLVADVKREMREAAPTAEQIAKQRLDEAHEGYLRREEEKYAAAAQREAADASTAEEARKKVEAERAAEADARARREAERQRQDQEAADRKAVDDANFRREREAAARELAEEQKRRAEEIARESADRARREAEEQRDLERARAAEEEKDRLLAEGRENARAEQTAREVAEGKARTAKLLVEQAERDRAEARAKEKSELDANMAKAASEDAARRQREEAEKAASKPALHVVPAPAPSEPKGATVAPNGLPVPPPPAEILLPTIRFGNCVVAAHALGFRTLDDLYFVLLSAWKPNVPAIRAISGTAEELRGRIANNCTLKKLALDGGPAQVDDSDDE